jgi:SRSO17 transposase
MENRRNFANIERRLSGTDGQALQHFMSNSPWSAQGVFRQIQDDIKATLAPDRGSVLILDESADEKAGRHNAGASRQYNGRMGKVDVCQVNTCLCYANTNVGLWTMVDGELFLPKQWFGVEFAQIREELGIPQERQFETKLELGLKMVKRAKANALPFELLACDSLYGRDGQFRAELEALGVVYAAQVPADTQVYLSEPVVGVPQNKRGRPASRLVVLSADEPQDEPQEVRELAQSPQTLWQQMTVRHTERGLLQADFAVMGVWTVALSKRPRAEYLVIRRQADGECTYTLLNAPSNSPKQHLIEYSCQRYFTERTFEDAKTEVGWDEFCAQKYLAWGHHLALTALALWFVAQTKLEWAHSYERDPQLAAHLAVQALPALSTANVRELLKAVLPLPQLTPQQATELVVTHLVNRSRSTSSRLKSQMKPLDSS